MFNKIDRVKVQTKINNTKKEVILNIKDQKYKNKTTHDLYKHKNFIRT